MFSPKETLLIEELTHAPNTSVVVLPELHGQLNDNPDANGDEAGSSNVGHDLHHPGWGFSNLLGTTESRVVSIERRILYTSLRYVTLPRHKLPRNAASLHQADTTTF